MSTAFLSHISDTLAEIDAEGLTKRERLITSPQGGEITVGDRRVINLCANNYLGLADHPALIAAAKGAMDDHGFGMASVRFICGTQDLHRELETRLAQFLGMEDSILFAACFAANCAVFEPLLGPEDAVISDALNHASIIDGIRLCKAKRYRYANSDMADLEAQLKAGPMVRATSWWQLTGSSRWTATSPSLARSGRSPTSTRPSLWSTTVTPPDSWGRRAGAPRRTRASRWTC